MDETGTRDTSSGVDTDRLGRRHEEEPGDASTAGTDMPSGGLLSDAGTTTAGLLDDHIAAEAGALGGEDGAVSDAAEDRRRDQSLIGRSGADALGGSPGRGETGSGTAPDRGELGGGGASLQQGGGNGPRGASSPGGNGAG